ncbi:hypothetical protein FSP39_000633 [Pinctada imbricata]|uniref:Endoplasmic reticulum junction formation protein lunapark n=1 Tax=Pinctada imbricata TaxID=66713 RepID=A0AA88YHB3_PINIB|nr:hypothetical protein FSP39_000633 [Pinctada imbricata]
MYQQGRGVARPSTPFSRKKVERVPSSAAAKKKGEKGTYEMGLKANYCSEIAQRHSRNFRFECIFHNFLVLNTTIANKVRAVDWKELPKSVDVRQRINAAMTKTNTATPRPQGPAMRPLTPYPKAGNPRPYSTPHLPRSGGSGIQPRQLVTPQYNANAIYGQPPGPPLPRPVFDRERTKMDRMLEYLLGDGPQNRYALICKSCHSHNGMALKEEFEYLSKFIVHGTLICKSCHSLTNCSYGEI